jgi:ribosomal protein L19
MEINIIYFEKLFEEELKDELLLEEEKQENIISDYFIKQRKNRDNIKNSLKIKKFWVGDIIEFVYFYKSISLVFKGMCIAIKKKGFSNPFLVFILRNIIIKTGVELIILYFFRRAYNLKFLDYKRKFFTFNKNKLYYIRYLHNRKSRVN